MQNVTLTREQAAVFQAIEGTREHVFVTGRAGTGKSTLLNHLNWHTQKQIVICAPTGVAALNVGGQTIHSLFRLPIGVIADHDIDQNDTVRKILNAMDTLVIDEVSMVNADLMDAMDRSLRQARQRPYEPFGGAQVVLFGDPYQLAPVPGSGDERRYFADTYTSMWFFDANVWREADLRIYELGEVHRQHDDEFKLMLNAVRHGAVTAEIAGVLNDVGARRPLPEQGAITLATTNETVNRINRTQLHRLPGQSIANEAEVNGDFGGRAFPADERLELKLGAQVMFLRNDNALRGDGPRWVNGTIGTVTSLKREVRVEIDGEEHEVEPVTWEKFRYTWDPAAQEAAPRDRGRVHAVPAPARVGGHDPQVAGRQLRDRHRRPRPPGVQPRPDLRRAQPPHGARRALPEPAAATERHHRRPRRRAVHGRCAARDRRGCRGARRHRMR